MATPLPLPFGALLRRHRVMAGLTQETLAERAGLSVRAISDLERGVNRTPQPGTLDLLAEALQLEAAERDAFAAAARREKLQEPQDPTPLVSVSVMEQHGEQESTHPPRRYGSLPVKRPSTYLVLGLLAVVVVAASVGLGYWLRLWPSGKGVAVIPTPVHGYPYIQPTHPGGTITISGVTFPDSNGDNCTNPLCNGQEGPAGFQLAQALWGTPFTVTPDGTLLPDELMEIPTRANGDISLDGRTITMHLRTDLKWSDGQPLVADDFKFWLEVWLDPAFGPCNCPLDQLDSSQVQDAHTLKLHFKQFLVDSLFFLPSAIPRHAWGSMSHQKLFNQEDDALLYPTVTSGPFKLESPTSYVPGQSITMVPNKNYRSSTLHASVLDKLIFKVYPPVLDQQTANADALIAAFKTGKTDFADPEFFLIQALPELLGLSTLRIQPSVDIAHLDFNLNQPALQDLQVRKAIEEAIDRCAMIKLLFQVTCDAFQVDTIVPKPSLEYDPTITTYAYDLAQARKDMQVAGWDCSSSPCTREGQPFPTLNLVAYGAPMYRMATQAVSQNLAALGIPVRVNISGYPVFFTDYNSGGTLATGQYDLSLFSYGPGIDVYGFMYTIFHSSQIPSASNPYGGNYERVNDPNIDALLEQGRTEVDGGRRTQLYQDLQRLLVKEVYTVPLFLRPNLALVNSKIGNYLPNPTDWGNLWNVGDWFLMP